MIYCELNELESVYRKCIAAEPFPRRERAGRRSESTGEVQVAFNSAAGRNRR